MRKILVAASIALASFGASQAVAQALPQPAPNATGGTAVGGDLELMPEYLGNCRPSGPTRFSTYWAFSVTCTSGTGGVQSKLSILTTSGAIVTDYGPCVGKYSGSPAYVSPPWYLGGMSGSSVWVANWRSC